jgi:hypothetical protein
MGGRPQLLGAAGMKIQAYWMLWLTPPAHCFSLSLPNLWILSRDSTFASPCFISLVGTSNSNQMEVDADCQPVADAATDIQIIQSSNPGLTMFETAEPAQSCILSLSDPIQSSNVSCSNQDTSLGMMDDQTNEIKEELPFIKEEPPLIEEQSTLLDESVAIEEETVPIEEELAYSQEAEQLPEMLEHIPSIEGVDPIPVPIQEIPVELPDLPDVTQSFNDAAPANIREPGLIPPFASAGLLSTALSSLRDGNLMLGAVLTQLRDLNLRIRTCLDS